MEALAIHPPDPEDYHEDPALGLPIQEQLLGTARSVSGIVLPNERDRRKNSLNGGIEGGPGDAMAFEGHLQYTEGSMRNAMRHMVYVDAALPFSAAVGPRGHTLFRRLKQGHDTWGTTRSEGQLYCLLLKG